MLFNIKLYSPEVNYCFLGAEHQLPYEIIEICFPRKVNAPVCGHFLIFSSIHEANDKKPYDNPYKHYPE